METICIICGVNPAPNPKYYGMCAYCRSKKYDFSKGKHCPDCGIPVNNKATRCIPCAQKLRRKVRKSTCKYCGVEFVFARNGGFVYCSRSCSSMDANQKRRDFKERTDKIGYVEKWDESRRAKTRVHVTKAEKVLGRRLKKGEIVHHINLDKSDNRNCNLLICTHSYHRWLHHQMELAWVREHPELKEPH